MIYVILILLILHAVGCFLVLQLDAVRAVNVQLSAFPLMVLVPVFGPAAALFLGFYKRKNLAQTNVEVPRFQLETEIYRSMGMDTSVQSDIVPLEEAMLMNMASTRRNLMMDLVKDNVVPLEEALTISNSQVRRKLMMDVLNGDTSKYYALLEQARLNDDVEVVHYATTAMSELNKKYDLMLDRFSKAAEADPEDLEVLAGYCSCLKQYLSLGLAKGAMLSLRQKECIAQLQRLCRLQPEEKNFRDLAKQQILAESYAAADATLQDAENRWPDSEEVWLLRLEYFVRQGDGETVQRMASSVTNGGVYLSTKAKEQLAFWLKKGSVV